MPVGEQIAILYCGVNGLLKDVPIDQVRKFQEEFLQRMRCAHAEDVLNLLSQGSLTDEIKEIIEKEAASLSQHYVVEK